MDARHVRDDLLLARLKPVVADRIERTFRHVARLLAQRLRQMNREFVAAEAVELPTGKAHRASRSTLPMPTINWSPERWPKLSLTYLK